MFSPLWRTQAPFPAAMLSAEILSGSGNPRWNHLPRHDSGKEHREAAEEGEPEMEAGGLSRPRCNWGGMILVGGDRCRRVPPRKVRRGCSSFGRDDVPGENFAPLNFSGA